MLGRSRNNHNVDAGSWLERESVPSEECCIRFMSSHWGVRRGSARTHWCSGPSNGRPRVRAGSFWVPIGAPSREKAIAGPPWDQSPWRAVGFPLCCPKPDAARRKNQNAPLAVIPAKAGIQLKQKRFFHLCFYATGGTPVATTENVISTFSSAVSTEGSSISAVSASVKLRPCPAKPIPLDKSCRPQRHW